MDDKAVQSALREMQRHLADRRLLAGMAVVALLLGLGGPFGTFDKLGVVPRIAYWGAIVFITYAIGVGTNLFVHRIADARLKGRLLRFAVPGFVAGVPITAAVVLVNLMLYGSDGLTVSSITTLWLSCTVIAIGINILASLFAAVEQPAEASGPPPILERVPQAQRGRLISLSVADHYVEVTTEKGRALVLMRFADAIRETGSEPGLQIHRSHWVALDAVAGNARQGGKLLVELKDGRRLPVSRSYRAEARAAGLVT